VAYITDTGDRIAARYYSLSDDSLHFVKVTMPDGKEYTLPNVMSGSGARYTDDFELVWWTKGSEVFVEMRDQDGKWRPKYKSCKELR